jgi:CRP-like cAMP-binding protein
MTDLRGLLTQNAVFVHMSAAQTASIATCALHKHYAQGEFVALYGDMWPYFVMVGEGKISAVKESGEGRRLIVTTIGPGEIFWGMTFFNKDVPIPVTLEAREASQLYLWNRETLMPFLVENGEALWELCCEMVIRMQRASDIVEGLAFKTVAGRIAQLILDRFGGAGQAPIARDLTLDEMAAMVGTTREMVCRVLYRFADADLIHITRTEFMLTDKDGLAQMTGQ